jgi:hypothetical protein
LERLDLSDNKLFTLPDMPPKLFHLTVKNNGFEYIPPTIMECLSLRTLDISDNSLLNVPADITDLTNLRELDLSNNNLMALPDEMFDLKLEKLLIDGNDFLQSEVVRIKRLTENVGKQKPQKRNIFKNMNMFKKDESRHSEKIVTVVNEEREVIRSPRIIVEYDQDTTTYDPTFNNHTNMDEITHFHDGDNTYVDDGDYTDRSFVIDSDPTRITRISTSWEGDIERVDSPVFVETPPPVVSITETVFTEETQIGIVSRKNCLQLTILGFTDNRHG